ncbi:exosortase family protein XrtF [Flavobacterium album]|uniref:Exosortase family protein XrtF n=1 Tax=Flavobacterium album TaxID=2175091 RepID=A0A2S1QXD3_9FLAO|nr:exosortase family protein XrtF [Flavobacterium album]AWH85058.1 exosortase family protein XrtF [Flavobacterium album]
MDVLRKNRAFFLFLLKFGGSYLVLSLVYWAYLSRYDAATFEADGMTHLVAEQASGFVNLLGDKAHIEKKPFEASYFFFVNDRRVARVVEGCNAVSVIILFVAFIVAFSTTFKRTSLYILIGILLLHVLNVARVGLLGMGLYHYNEYGHLLHDIVFPLFIYGVVFALWVAWVMKFSGNKKKNAA